MENENLAIDTALTSVLKETVAQLNTALTAGGVMADKWFPKGIEIIRIEITVAGVVGKLTIAGPEHPVSLVSDTASEAEYEE